MTEVEKWQVPRLLPEGVDASDISGKWTIADHVITITEGRAVGRVADQPPGIEPCEQFSAASFGLNPVRTTISLVSRRDAWIRRKRRTRSQTDDAVRPTRK